MKLIVKEVFFFAKTYTDMSSLRMICKLDSMVSLSFLVLQDRNIKGLFKSQFSAKNHIFRLIKTHELEFCCSLEIDECSYKPCQNGGQCSNHIGGYGCNCRVGFIGNNCETYSGTKCCS